MATDPYTVEGYNKSAENYHRHVSDKTESVYHSYYEKPAIRAELPDLEGLDVISIGCGSGVDARWLKDNGANKVVGIDISKELIKIAKQNNPDIEFHVMDMEKLDFTDNSFDLAYSSLAIHYIDDWVQPLKEAYRILKPGGLYVFSCGHPIDTAMDYITEGDISYRLLGQEKSNETNTRKIYGDYLVNSSKGVKPIKGKLRYIQITVYHRTMSKMIEEILSAGFTIQKMVEPQPTKEMFDSNPGPFERLSKIPFFMIWVLKK